MLNRWVLSRDQKTATEGAEVARSGRLFQTRAAATGKARSPMVDSRVQLIVRPALSTVGYTSTATSVIDSRQHGLTNLP